MVLADLDESFYERAFPQLDVKDEAGMRARLKSQIEQGYAAQENMQYRGEAMQALMEGVELPLPDAFVKKYIVEKDPNYTAENIDEKYPELQKSLEFQLMESAIAQDGDVKIEYSDVINYIHNYISINYLGAIYQYLDEASKTQVQKMAESMLKQESTVNSVYDNIYFERITDIIREKSAAKIVEVSMEEFLGSSADNTSKTKKPRSKKSTVKKADANAEPENDKAEEQASENQATPKKAAPRKSSKKSVPKE